ncbi:MAG: leucine-rich repeat protein [Clostridia bacterium]|nr:leucine-rich repeat protein [Clostridia bacterium]
MPGNHPDKEIEIPYGITRLGISCFFNSTIRKVHLPESLRTIDDICFEHTHRLIELVIPDSVRVLGAGMLFASAIRHLMIPSGAAVMKNICPGCSRLEEITVMPGNETVCSIDGVLFTADQEKLLTYPANKDLQEYTVPFGTVTIDQVAFKDTLNLRNVILPESVTELGYYAFVNSGITSITIPDSCRVIDEGVFSGCMNLKEFIVSPTHPCLDAIDGKYLYSKDHTIFYCFPDGLTETMFVLEPETKTIRSAAFGSSLMEIRLPEGLEEIGQGVFFATKIKSLYIPGTVKSIGMQAFSFCHELETVGIGEGVEEITDRAFHGSKKLKGVSIPASVKQIDGLAFSDTENVVIYTPEGSYAHTYAVQNQLKVETAPGAYSVFTQNVRDGIEISPVGGAACKVRIKKGTTANIREKPDMDSRRVGRGKAGDEFTWLETVEKDGTTWYKVELEDGAAGYVHAKMSELIEL